MHHLQKYFFQLKKKKKEKKTDYILFGLHSWMSYCLY